MIISCVNTKGGVGKTTTAIHLAAMFNNYYLSEKTLLIDGDKQQSASSWAAWRQENGRVFRSPTTVCLFEKAILSEGKKIAEDYRYTIVDVGGRDSIGLRSSLLIANLAIIPIGASSLDACAMTDLLEIIDLAKEFNPDLLVRVLLTRIDNRTTDTQKMSQHLKEEGLTVLKTHICERVAYRRAISDGRIVQEYNKDPHATIEMNSLFDEVQEIYVSR